MQDQCATPMPKYRCHKEVWALKISEVIHRRPDGTGPQPALKFADEGFAMLWISDEFIQKHKPEAGGYFVKYADGYKSFSPAAAFEEGYTRIDG